MKKEDEVWIVGVGGDFSPSTVHSTRESAEILVRSVRVSVTKHLHEEIHVKRFVSGEVVDLLLSALRQTVRELRGIDISIRESEHDVPPNIYVSGKIIEQAEDIMMKVERRD